MDMDQGHPIQVIVRRTGLSPHVIRVWEKRYGAVKPTRTPTNRRRYSDTDIERLLLLQRAKNTGRSIGQIAHLPIDTLRDLVHDDEYASVPPTAPTRPTTESLPTQWHLDASLAAVERLDATELEVVLMRARVALSQPAFIEQLIAPMMETIGNLWRDGSLRIMHEHLASAVVRTFMGNLKNGSDMPASTPKLIVTTPLGQWHEIGALIVASTAAAEGWHVTYLGPNLPAEEIAAAVQYQCARAVALSLVHPADDPRMHQELTTLRRYVERNVALLVGGRGIAGYHETLDTIEAVRLNDMQQLRMHLQTLRSRPS